MDWTFWDVVGAVVFAQLAASYLLSGEKDIYVVKSSHYERLNVVPFRGKQTDVVFGAFFEFAAAKAHFDVHETYFYTMFDNEYREYENSVYMVSARSKSAAVKEIAKHSSSGLLLAKTPDALIQKRRKDCLS